MSRACNPATKLSSGRSTFNSRDERALPHPHKSDKSIIEKTSADGLKGAPFPTYRDLYASSIRAQTEESAKFIKGPDVELLDHNKRQMLGPEGTILIHNAQYAQEDFRRTPQRTEPVMELRDHNGRRMLGPEGTILVRND